MSKVFHVILTVFIIALIISFGWGIEWIRWTVFCNFTHTHISFWAWMMVRGL